MKKLIILISVILTFGISNSHSQTVQSFFYEADAIFKSYVVNGKVDYPAIKNSPDKLISVMETAQLVRVSIKDPKTYQAFWINAYNLAVIKGIVDNYPIKSPLDKKGFFDKTKYDLGGTSITLNDIENRKLRAQFDDARFHFVLVCGAMGCPPIIGKAYTASNLENLLEQQTINALNDNTFIKVTEKNVAFSEIFKWYKEDFVKEGQTEIDFLNNYRMEKVPKDAKVTYYLYDWRLNSN